MTETDPHLEDMDVRDLEEIAWTVHDTLQAARHARNQARKLVPTEGGDAGRLDATVTVLSDELRGVRNELHRRDAVEGLPEDVAIP